LETVATAASLQAAEVAAIVLAVGARPRRHAAADTKTTLSVDEALTCSERIGDRVAIYIESRHLAALVLAESLARSGRTVTVATPHASVGGDLDPNSYNDIRRRLAAAGARIVPEVLLHHVGEHSLVVSDVWPYWPAGYGEPSRVIAFDTLVCDLGDEPRDELAAELDSSGLLVVRIGDCLTPRNVIGAVHDGAGLAPALEQRLIAAATLP
jgi:hypothetical protein